MTVLELGYEGEYAELDDRERDRTREDRVRASVSSRMRLATVRFSYEYAWRDADSFDPDYRTPFMFSSLPGYEKGMPEEHLDSSSFPPLHP